MLNSDQSAIIELSTVAYFPLWSISNSNNPDCKTISLIPNAHRHVWNG